MAVTMKDVAKHANLSLGTVSNYVNGKSSVSQENKAKIEESIRVLGYHVNEVARMLKSNSFKTIGVLIPTFRNVYILKLVGIVEELLRKSNYQMLVYSYHLDEQKENELLSYLSQRVDGILYAPTAVSKDISDTVGLIQKRIPIVTINERLEKVTCDNVVADNLIVGEKAVSALLERGHEKIAMIAGPVGIYTTKQRVLGYQNAYKAHNVKIDKHLVRFTEHSKESARELCKEMLDKNSDITAFFIAGFRMTLGVMAEIERRGLSDKISIIGYDADTIEDIMTPKLCYVEQPFNETANEVARLILKRVGGDYSDFPLNVKQEGLIKNIDSIRRI